MKINNKEAKIEEFGSNEYKGIYFCVMPDCAENLGGYYIEFYKIIDEETGDIDFDNRLDYMVIHVDNENEMENPEKVVKSYIDGLLKEIENENQEEIM